MYDIKVLLEKRTEQEYRQIGFVEEKYLLVKGERGPLIEGYRIIGPKHYAASKMLSEITVQHSWLRTRQVEVIHYAIIAEGEFTIQQWRDRGRKSRLVSEDRSGVFKDAQRINLADVVRPPGPAKDPAEAAKGPADDDYVDPELEAQALAAGIGVDLGDIEDDEVAEDDNPHEDEPPDGDDSPDEDDDPSDDEEVAGEADPVDKGPSHALVEKFKASRDIKAKNRELAEKQLPRRDRVKSKENA